MNHTKFYGIVMVVFSKPEVTEENKIWKMICSNPNQNTSFSTFTIFKSLATLEITCILIAEVLNFCP